MARSRRKVGMNGLWRPVADISLFLPAMMIGAEGQSVLGEFGAPSGCATLLERGVNGSRREANPQPRLICQNQCVKCRRGERT
jgi:hypothetical protein